MEATDHHRWHRVAPCEDRSKAALVTAIAILLLMSVTVANGAVMIMAPWDVLVLLDGAWRAFVGQVPHTDFHNPIGPLTYDLIALGMQAVGPSLRAVAVGTLTFSVIAAFWAWLVGSRRLPPILAALFTANIALLGLAVQPLGYSSGITTYAMLYNRFAWVLTSILFVQIFISPLSPAHGARIWRSGISIGLLLGLLFFCKISHFGMGLLGVALANLLDARTRRSISAQASAFLFVLVAYWLSRHVSTIAYVRDIISALGAQSPEQRLGWLLQSVRANRFGLYALVGLSATALVVLPSGCPGIGGRSGGKARFATYLMFVVISTLAIASGDAPEGTDLPLLFVGLLMLMRHLADQSGVRGFGTSVPQRPISAPQALLAVAGVVLLPILVLHTTVNDMAGMLRAAANNARSLAYVQIQSQPLADFRVPTTSMWQTAYWRAKDLPDKLNDGLRLLRKHGQERGRIFTLAFGNPFPLALRVPPPRGTPLWWDLNFSVGADGLPKPHAVFSDVDVVLVPILRQTDEGCCRDTADRMLERYSTYLEEHFPEVERSEHWSIRLRRDAVVSEVKPSVKLKLFGA